LENPGHCFWDVLFAPGQCCGEIVAKTVLWRVVALLIGLIDIVFTGMGIGVAVCAVDFNRTVPFFYFRMFMRLPK